MLRAGFYDLINIKEVMLLEGTIVGTHRNNEMPHHWVFIDI